MLKISWQFLIGSILILSCTKEEKFEFPLVQTGEVIQVDDAGVVFQAKILSELSGNEIDHGFVWDTHSVPSLESGYSKSLGPAKDALFSAHIGSYFISGQEYFVRAYVATSEHLVYGRPVSFISKGGGNIEVSDFYPKTGSWGDTISIVHKNISYKKGETKVFFGVSLAEVISSQDSVIKVLVPTNLKQSPSQLSITVADANFSVRGQFGLLPMVIDDFMPKLVTFRDTITISGKNFNSGIEYNNIYLNGEKATPVSCTQNAIQVLVSDNIKNSDQFPSIKIVVWDFECSANDLLQVKSPVIANFSPDEADRRDNLRITGSFFNPTPNENKVYVGTVEAEILSATSSELITNIPNGVVHGSNKVSVEVANTKVEAESELFIYEPWKRLDDFPDGPRYLISAYSTSNHAYISANTLGCYAPHNDLWEYTQSTNSWQKKNVFVMGCMLGFNYKNNTYHFEIRNLYKYDAVSDTRELISVGENIPYPNFYMVFVKDDIAYFINNNTGTAELWEYSFTDNSWSEDPKVLSISPHGTFGFENGDDVFYISSAGSSENKLFKFDFTAKDFIEHLDLRSSEYLGKVMEASVFSIDNYSYIIDGHHMNTTSRFNCTIRYDKVTNSYTEILKPPFEARSMGIEFSIGRKGYCGLGSSRENILSDIWEFDPDKMKPE